MHGRVISDHKGGVMVLTDDGREVLSVVSGKLRRAHALGEADKPVVGDFVELDAQRGDHERAIIKAIAPRKTVIRRKLAGADRGTQVVLANVDVVLVAMSLNEDFNLRRLERYLAVVWDGGAVPVVLLTKADLANDVDAKLEAVKAVAKREAILVTSSANATGLDALDAALEAGKTYALLGSSGVGKSTLVNRWLGAEAQVVKNIRDDGKGRHTTTHRELFRLAGGAFVVDTPGMRELGLSEELEGGVSEAFADVDALASECRFSDCLHASEPGCAVLAALAAGTLTQQRFDSYAKLMREAAARAVGEDPQTRAARKRKERAGSKAMKEVKRR